MSRNFVFVKSGAERFEEGKETYEYAATMFVPS